MNKYRILIAGGDMRQIYCANRLSQEFETGLTGFDRDSIPYDIGLPIADICSPVRYDCAVLPVPPIDDAVNIYTPCSSGTLTFHALQELLTENAVIFAGKVTDRLKNALPAHEICDYMLSEELNIKNAVPTAEGAVLLALKELPVTLNGLRVLVTGLGRIGTALVRILQGFGADITAAVHNPRGAAKARLCGIRSVPTRRLGNNYDLVFNTVPKLIFDRNILEKFDSSTLFIDLASKPGGIDFDAAVSLGLKVIWALGLPGKTAPVSSGEFIAEAICSMLAERSEDIE